MHNVLMAIAIGVQTHSSVHVHTAEQYLLSATQCSYNKTYTKLSLYEQDGHNDRPTCANSQIRCADLMTCCLPCATYSAFDV